MPGAAQFNAIICWRHKIPANFHITGKNRTIKTVRPDDYRARIAFVDYNGKEPFIRFTSGSPRAADYKRCKDAG